MKHYICLNYDGHIYYVTKNYRTEQIFLIGADFYPIDKFEDCFISFDTIEEAKLELEYINKNHKSYYSDKLKIISNEDLIIINIIK